MHSAIYEGKVRHRRNFPKLHQFDFKLFMLWIDLDELDEIFRGSWLWSTKKPAFARFQPDDYLKAFRYDSDAQPVDLRSRVNRALQANGVTESIKRVRLLTQVRYFGYAMNPISLFYCYDSTGEQLLAIIAEVNNTPWGEQHVYVLSNPSELQSAELQTADSQTADSQNSAAQTPNSKLPQPIKAARIEKAFHVSPFMSMDMFYRMAMTVPDSRLLVKIENHLTQEHHEIDRNGKRSDRILDVVMSLQRKEISLTRLRWMLIKYPLQSVRVFASIYWQALRLHLKRIKFYPHSVQSETKALAEQEILKPQIDVN